MKGRGNYREHLSRGAIRTCRWLVGKQDSEDEPHSCLVLRKVSTQLLEISEPESLISQKLCCTKIMAQIQVPLLV